MNDKMLSLAIRCINIFYGLFMLCTPLALYSNQIEDLMEELPKIGNYSLQDSQQPGPLFSFGQTIVDKGQKQLSTQPVYIKGQNQSYFELSVSAIYGVNDNLTISFNAPLAIDYRNALKESSGISDVSFQAEYAFYNASNKSYSDEATVVGQLIAPSGSLDKEPATGNGSFSYFLGYTYSRLYVDWYLFLSPGVQWVSPKKNIQLGSLYLYEFGVGHNIVSKTNQYQLLGLLEINGIYQEKDKISGVMDLNSGGNIVTLGPSLEFATNRAFIQLGMAIPIIQQLNGSQKKQNYITTFAFTWTFQ